MSIFENTTKLNGLNDEDLEKVSGGYVYAAGEDDDLPYEVINDARGIVLGRYATLEEAKKAAREEFHMSDETIDWIDLMKLRAY